jgi:hypothetical protein
LTYFFKMNQSNVTSRRRKPDNLSKSLKFEITQRTDKHVMADRPRTPYPTWMKRSYDAPEEQVAKKRKITEDEAIATTSTTHLISFPSLDSGQSLVDLGCRFSSTDLTRASESIFKQVDWSRVVLDVLGEERPAMFRDAFTEILQARIEELLRQEASQETNMGVSDIMNRDDNGNGGVVEEENGTGKKGYGKEDGWAVEEYLADEEAKEESRPIVRRTTTTMTGMMNISQLGRKMRLRMESRSKPV